MKRWTRRRRKKIRAFAINKSIDAKVTPVNIFAYSSESCRVFIISFKVKTDKNYVRQKKNPPLKSAEIIIIFNLDSNQLTFTSSIRSDIFNRQLKSHRLGCNGPKTFELPIRSIEFGFEIRRWFMLYSNSQYSRQVRRASKASTSMVALCKTIVTAVALFKFQFPFLAVQVVHETRPKMNLMLSTSGHQTGY